MKFLYRLANTFPGRFLIGWVFAHMSFVLPAQRLRETDSLLAFYHPKPAHPFHVILAPKKDIRSFADLAPADPFLVDLITTVQGLVAEFHLSAYRLIVNGGEYQEFPYLHFHLISDVGADGRPPLREN
jgi:histidine triad (HIT) family protein